MPEHDDGVLRQSHGGGPLGIAGQIALKSETNGSATVVAQFLNPLTMFGLAPYVVALKKIPVSIALPLCDGELRDRGCPRTFAMERAFRLAATDRHRAHRQRGVLIHQY